MILGENQQQFASPEEALMHYGKKGMRWGVRNEDDLVGFTQGPLKPGTPEFQRVVERVTRTDHPQVLTPPSIGGQARTPKKEDYKPKTELEQHGLTDKQKVLLTFGAVTAAAAGYYAYQHYTGRNVMADLDPAKIKQQEEAIAGLKLPAKWDVSGLRTGPLSKQRLGDLTGGVGNLKLIDAEDLVVNTSRGYADILPKNGLPTSFAIKQHASATRVLEEMRDKYPAVRNMNIEVVPMSNVLGMSSDGAHMAVMHVRAGEARLMYNDFMSEPDARTIWANRKFLPGLGKKDYVAYHEMGHILAAAHGELPPAIDLVSGKAGPALMNKYTKADILKHKRMFTKHGFTFKELSGLSKYAATEPAEAMAELAGHYFSPEMRSRLTPDQLTRAEAMFNEMGGLT